MRSKYPSKTAAWMATFAAPGADEKRQKSEIARALGLSPSFAGRVMRGDVKGDLSLSTLDKIAAHRRRKFGEGVDAGDIARRILATGTDGEPIEEVEAKQEDAVVTLWRRLFSENPERGEEVLINLSFQEEAGYSVLVSRIVRAIIRLGPKDAIPKVVELLSRTPDDRSARIRKIRERYEEETRRLQ